MAAYTDCGIDSEAAVWDAMQKIYELTEQKFLFILDEWDAVFHMPFISGDDRGEFLLFLKWMLKDQPYVEFAYMTGVLPIAKYSSGSELNMFVEYDMAGSEKFSEYFGFTNVDEAEKFQKLIAELEMDIMPVDGLIAFAGSEDCIRVFGAQAAENVKNHVQQLKDSGEKYCDCPACAAAAAILEKKDLL